MGVRRGQFQILTAVILVTLMILARTVTVSNYTVNLRDVDSDVASIQAQVNQAVLASLAYASNTGTVTDVQSRFTDALGEALGNITAANYGLYLQIISASATITWDDTPATTYGAATINITSTTLGSSWTLVSSQTLTQYVDAENATSTRPLPSLVTFQVPVQLTLNGISATWVNGTVLYDNGSYPAVLEQNYGNGDFLLQFSIPYSSLGLYDVALLSWDASMVVVSSETTLAASF